MANDSLSLCDPTEAGTGQSSCQSTALVCLTISGPASATQRKSAFQQRQKRNGDSAVKLPQVQSLCKRGNGKCEARNEIYGNETFCRRQHGWTCLVLAWHGYRQNIASIDKKMATAKGHQETENGTPVSLAVWSLNWSFRVRVCRHAQKVPRLTKRSPHEGLM